MHFKDATMLNYRISPDGSLIQTEALSIPCGLCETAPTCFLGTRRELIFLLEKVNNIQLFPSISISMIATLRG